MRLPFLADDLFINYDDDRAAAGFAALAELERNSSDSRSGGLQKSFHSCRLRLRNSNRQQALGA
jgi:hypothetical protein